MKHAAKLLREARVKSGMSQGTLAQVFNLTSGQFISNMERAVTPIPLDKAAKICGLLGIRRQEMIDAMTKDMQEALKLKMKEYAKVLRG